jgi:hypothetical protein
VRHINGVIGLAAVGVLAGCGSSAGSEAAAEPAPTVTVTVPGPTVTKTVEPPEPEPVATAGPEDFGFSVVVLSEECFGSAGCLVEWEIDEATYLGEGTFEGPARILYDVEGLEDPKSGYVEVDGSGNFSYSTERDSTTEPGVVPSITVTDVRMS